MKHEWQLYTNSEKETMDFGQMVGKHAENDLFIALAGDLGTGKTHFVQGLAKGMGISGVVGSPTFTIMNYYDGKLPLKHFDFYRLRSLSELYGIGWEEYSAGGVTVAEWADMFPEAVPPEALWIRLENTGETGRRISVSWEDGAPETIIKEIQAYAFGH